MCQCTSGVSISNKLNMNTRMGSQWLFRVSECSLYGLLFAALKINVNPVARETQSSKYSNTVHVFVSHSTSHLLFLYLKMQ